MKSKIGRILLSIGLSFVLWAGAATAQFNNGGSVAPVGIYTGEEIDEGSCARSLITLCYGNVFALSSFGEWETHHLTVSIDYMGGINPKQGLSVIDGSWTLVVYRDNAYAGTLNGHVLGGTVVIDDTANLKHVQLDLRSVRGSGFFEGKDGENIRGSYRATTNMRSKETSGNAYFGF